MKKINVLFYPAIENEADFNDTVARAAWYLSPLDVSKIYIIIDKLDTSFKKPSYIGSNIDRIYDKFKNRFIWIKSNNDIKIRQAIEDSNLFLRLTKSAKLKSEHQKRIMDKKRNGFPIRDVNRLTIRRNESNYIEASYNLSDNKDKELEACKIKYKKFIKGIPSTIKTRAYIFGTGPSINTYAKYNYDDGISIICNTLIINKKFIEHVKPKVLCITDSLFHFSPTNYAFKLRESISKHCYEKGIYIFTTQHHYHNFVYHYPHLKELTIGIPFVRDAPINFDLSQNFYVNAANNVLTIFMLPLACSIADEIVLTGFDGRPKNENNYFFKYGENFQLNDEYHTLKESTPAFFNIDYNKDNYFPHLAWIDKYIGYGKKLGKKFFITHPTYIDAFKNFVYIGNDFGIKFQESFINHVNINKVQDKKIKNHNNSFIFPTKKLLSKNAGQKSNTILLVQPTHVTALEHNFWDKFVNLCFQNNYNVIQVYKRPNLSVNSYLNCFSIFYNNFNYIGKNFLKTHNQVIPEFDRIDKNVYNFMTRFHKYTEPNSVKKNFIAGMNNYLYLLKNIFEKINPVLLINTNDILHNVMFARYFANYNKTKNIIVERSPIGSLWVEESGLFSRSSIWNNYKYTNIQNNFFYKNKGKQVCNWLNMNIAGGFRESTIFKSLNFEIIKKPIFFLPMDNVNQTGWLPQDHFENVNNYPLFPSPYNAIKQIQEVVQRIGGSLVVKAHPSDIFITKEHLPTHTFFYEGNLDYAIENSDVVICFLSKLAFNSMSLKKPVVTLAKNPIVASDCTYHLTDINNLRKCLEDALNKKDYNNKHTKFLYFVGWLANNFFISMCDESDNLHNNRNVDTFFSYTMNLIHDISLQYIPVNELLPYASIFGDFLSGNMHLDDFNKNLNLIETSPSCKLSTKRHVNSIPHEGKLLENDNGKFNSLARLKYNHTSRNHNKLLIVGNGPSLRDFEFEKLFAKPWIGMNAAYRYWHKVKIYPFCYVCLDTVVIEHHKQEIFNLIRHKHEYGINHFFLRNKLLKTYPELAQIPEVHFFEQYYNTPYFEGITGDLTTGSFSVLIGAMLGYMAIYLLGIDLGLVDLPEAKNIGGYILEMTETPTHNPNYFFDDYQKKGDRFNIPDSTPNLHQRSWQTVKERAQNLGLSVFNCNKKSNLKIFDYANIDDVLSADFRCNINI